MLGVRPELTWRDVQHIIQQTATKNDPLEALHPTKLQVNSPSWAQNGASVWYSYQYGFGRVNAGCAVSLAKSWTLLGAPTGIASPVIAVTTQSIDDIGTVVTSTYTVSTYDGDAPTYIEHVMVYASITHTRIFDVRIVVVSPAGTRAILLDGATITAFPDNMVIDDHIISHSHIAVVLHSYDGMIGDVSIASANVLGRICSGYMEP